MPGNQSFSKQLRLERLYRYGDERLLVVPLDHAVTSGPIVVDGGLVRLVGQLADSNVDAVVLHKGSLRHLDHRWFTRTALIVHLSASTAHAPDPDSKYLVSSVENALRLGADAVSVHVNLGSDSEKEQVADLATVSDACDRWNMPLLAMMYPRGPRIADPRDPALIAHAATLAEAEQHRRRPVLRGRDDPGRRRRRRDGPQHLPGAGPRRARAPDRRAAARRRPGPPEPRAGGGGGRLSNRP